MNISIISIIKRYVNRIIAYLVGFVLRPSATSDTINFRIWEKRGYHITPDNFYSPIPNISELEREFPNESGMFGLKLNLEEQICLLNEIVSGYSIEYNSFDIRSSNPDSFHLDNDAFSGIDPYVYYCMIRYFKPKKIIEIGSGYSTLLAHQALKRNNSDFKFIIIDPWPRDFTNRFLSNNSSSLMHFSEKAENIDINTYLNLQKNDILFIDGSHVVRIGGDVCFLVLELLPQLSSGVIIHFHDIFIPNDYPKDWVVNKHLFWSEQYLLQAYITENDNVEILFASNFVSKKAPKILKNTFPMALWWGGGSFWIRKL